MNIETKFTVGDNIYFLNEKKAICLEIKEIVITVKPDADSIMYFCLASEDYGNLRIKVSEKDAFETKKQLIDSL
jgi:hypothetical protein